MFNRIRNAWSNHRKMVQRTAGWEEKEASMKAKLDKALEILNEKRKEDVPVVIERRFHGTA